MKKGFTLLELLIVIGIIAILATATVLVLNPAELLREARDSQRLSDLDSVKSALSLLLATATTTTVHFDNAPTTDYCATVWWTHVWGAASPFSAALTTASTTDETIVGGGTGMRGINGQGWIRTDLRGATGGSPVPALPVDPTASSTTNFYAFACNQANLTFEIDANLESARYATKEASDGGSSNTVFEVGTDPGLDL